MIALKKQKSNNTQKKSKRKHSSKKKRKRERFRPELDERFGISVAEAYKIVEQKQFAITVGLELEKINGSQANQTSIQI